MATFGQLTSLAAVGGLAIASASTAIAVNAQNQINQLQQTAMIGPDSSVELYSIPVFKDKSTLLSTGFFLEPTNVFSHPSGNQSIDFSVDKIINIKASQAVLLNDAAPITSSASSVTPNAIALYSTPNLLTPSSTLISDLATQSDLTNYLLLNGTSTMTGNLQIGLNSITNGNGASIDMSSTNHLNLIGVVTVNGGGLLVGPVSSTDRNLCRFNGITGSIIENSPFNLSDSGVLAGPSSQSMDMSVSDKINFTASLGVTINNAALVVGPNSSTTTAITRFQNTSGGVLENSTLLLSDTGVISSNLSTIDFSVNNVLNLTSGSVEANGSLIATVSTLATYVQGPVSSTTNAIATYLNAGGKTIQNSTLFFTGNIITCNSVQLDMSTSGTLNVVSTNFEFNGQSVITSAQITNFVSGPVSSTTNAIATYLNAGGKTIQNSTLFFTSDIITCNSVQLDMSTSGTLNVVCTNFEFNGNAVVTSSQIANFVSGPVSSVNNTLALFNGTGGKTIQDSNLSYTSNILSGPNGTQEFDFTTSNQINFITTTLTQNGVALVQAPASSTNNAIAVYNGVAGNVIKNSTLSFSGNILSANSVQLDMSTANTLNVVSTNFEFNGNAVATSATLSAYVLGAPSSTSTALAAFSGTSGKQLANTTLLFSSNVLSANSNTIDFSTASTIKIGGLFLNSAMNSNGQNITNTGNIYPSTTLTYDIGQVGNLYRNLYINNIVGPNQLQWDSNINQSESVCLAGLRDLYLPATGNGNFLNYLGAILYATAFTQVVYSTDGGHTYNAVIFTVAPTTGAMIGYNGSNLWVALGNPTDPVYTSSDGIHFTDHPTQNVTWFALSILFAFGLFITLTTNSSTSWISTSSDGITWTPRTTPNLGTFGDLGTFAFNGSIIVLASESSQNALIWSIDGINWNSATGGPTANAGCACFSSDWNQFYIQDRSTNQSYVSQDGQTWTLTGTLGLAGAIQTIWLGPPFNNYYQAIANATPAHNIVVGFSSNVQSRSFQSTLIAGTKYAPNGYLTILYLSSFNSFVIGNSDTSNLYSVARPNDIQALSNNIRVLNNPVDVAMYSTYSTINVNNTTTQTNISTTTNFLGTLTFPCPMPLGSIFFFDMNCFVTSSAGDTLQIILSSTPLGQSTNSLAQLNLTVPAASSNVSLLVQFKMVVSSTINVFMFGSGTISGQVPVLTGGPTNPLDCVLPNTFSITAQWGANVNQLEMIQLNIRSSFSNGS